MTECLSPQPINLARSDKALVGQCAMEKSQPLELKCTDHQRCGGAYAAYRLSAFLAGPVAVSRARLLSTWSPARSLRTATPRPELAAESGARPASLIGGSEETRCGYGQAPARCSGTRRYFCLHPFRCKTCES